MVPVREAGLEQIEPALAVGSESIRRQAQSALLRGNRLAEAYSFRIGGRQHIEAEPRVFFAQLASPLGRGESQAGAPQFGVGRRRLLLRDQRMTPGKFFRQPPYWWNPRSATDRVFYRSPSFHADGRGPDGSHYLLMYDRGGGTLYAWIKDNF